MAQGARRKVVGVGMPHALQMERKIEDRGPAGAGVGVVYMSKRKAVDLTKRDLCGKIGVDEVPSRWIACPLCRNPELIRVFADTRAVRMPVYCKRCRSYPEINID